MKTRMKRVNVDLTIAEWRALEKSATANERYVHLQATWFIQEALIKEGLITRSEIRACRLGESSTETEN